MTTDGAVRRCGKCGEPVTMPDVAAAISDAAGPPLCSACFALLWATKPKREEWIVPQRVTKYQFTEDMDEISGFGGGYEQTCRNMLATGCEWFDAHPDANPRFKGFKEVYGLCVEDNDDAKALSQAIFDGSGDDCTGAMHQAVVSACLYIRKQGWEKYQKAMSKRISKEGE